MTSALFPEASHLMSMDPTTLLPLQPLPAPTIMGWVAEPAAESLFDQPQLLLLQPMLLKHVALLKVSAAESCPIA